MCIGKKIGKVLSNLINILIEFGISTKQIDDKYLKIAISKRMI
jgi:hypothetical protein